MRDSRDVTERSLDREKTVLQQTGQLTVFPDYTLHDLFEIVLDLGIDPADVRCSAVSLTVEKTS